MAAGYVIWRGPSRITGAPIVAILTLRSTNRKTGPMAQTWYLHADLPPVYARRCGADAAVCGACPMREVCYVNVGQAPARVWAAWQRCRYPYLTVRDSLPDGTRVRLGAYGDPTSAPLILVHILQECGAVGFVGYTHRWRGADRVWSQYCMASCDGVSDSIEASKLGWRTFRARWPWDKHVSVAGEIECPAASGLTTCSKCMNCRGVSGRDAVIDAHGSQVAPFGRPRSEHKLRELLSQGVTQNTKLPL